MADLTPLPLASLARRMFRELARHDAIFGLPKGKFFAGVPGRDLSVSFHGRRVASPLGPAAGPHTQMAQNIVLSWLGGSRIVELKTVQILDRLEIPRPCIDLQTYGLNAEWSQELRLGESLEEYVKAAMLIEMLAASGRLDFEPGFGDGLAGTVFDLSVGYDLAGIRSEPVRAFIRGMMDAGPTVERLRAQLPPELGGLRQLDFTTRLGTTVTLSTFHGCPPDEIEGIIEHLMEEYGLDCIIKFNPTLLGRERLHELLHGSLGYDSLDVPDTAFEQDTSWEQAEAMMERLGEKATALGRSLGAKFSNTLIVRSPRDFIPPSEEQVYLSGQPLHVLAVHLVRRFRRRFGSRFPISFAAGIDRGNFAEAVALGLVPITICSDLLRPGGYARLTAASRRLVQRMEATGAQAVDDWILRAFEQGGPALEVVARGEGEGEAPERLDACRRALSEGGDWRQAAGDDLARRWLAETIRRNTEHYAEAVTEDPRYGAGQNAKPPRKIGRHLELFDCLTCDKCLPVCPNHANFSFRPPERSIPRARAMRNPGGRWTWQDDPPHELSQRHQIATFLDFCNACGNCDVFCPEDGGPFALKPRFVGSEAAWHEEADDAFHCAPEGGRILGRLDGRAYALEVEGGRWRFRGEGFTCAWDASDPAATLGVELEGDAADRREIELAPAFVLDLIRRTLADPEQIHYLRTPPLDPSDLGSAKAGTEGQEDPSP